MKTTPIETKPNKNNKKRKQKRNETKQNERNKLRRNRNKIETKRNENKLKRELKCAELNKSDAWTEPRPCCTSVKAQSILLSVGCAKQHYILNL